MTNEQQKKVLRDLYLEWVQELLFYVAVITIAAIAFGVV